MSNAEMACANGFPMPVITKAPANGRGTIRISVSVSSESRSDASDHLLEFPAETRPVGQVHRLRLVENPQDLVSSSRVRACALEIVHPRALLGEVPLAFGNVSLSQRQMISYRDFIHNFTTSCYLQGHPNQLRGRLAQC
jgi:hypothetical protein